MARRDVSPSLCNVGLTFRDHRGAKFNIGREGCKLFGLLCIMRKGSQCIIGWSQRVKKRKNILNEGGKRLLISIKTPVKSAN